MDVQRDLQCELLRYGELISPNFFADRQSTFANGFGVPTLRGLDLESMST